MPADAPVTTLLCSCGLRLKARGAVPGRLGRCPKCGALLRVPEATEGPSDDDVKILKISRNIEVPAPSDGYDLVPPPAEPAFEPHRDRPPAAVLAPKPKAAPTERHWYQSLGYPVWDAGGIALLVFMPPVLAFLTTLERHVAPLIFFENFLAGAAMALGLGTALLLLLALGLTCQHLGAFLAASAQGEPHHPNWPAFEAFEVLRALGRWLVAAAGGLVLGGGLGILDVLGLGEAPGFWARLGAGALLSLGTLYGLMALLAVTLFEDVRAANPPTVLRAAVLAGRGYLAACLLASVGLSVGAVAASYLAAADNPLAQLAGFWLLWAAALYGALVVLRVLGLSYHRRAAAIGWFRSRD